MTVEPTYVRFPTSILSTIAAASVLLFMGCGTSDDDPGGGGGDVTIGGQVPSRIETYIRSDTHPRLVLEVDAVPGLEPYTQTISRIETGLADILDKPDGVQVVLHESIEPRGEDHAWTRDSLVELAERKFNLEVDDGTAKIHALFIDGHDENDSAEGRTLGLAWSHRHIVIYKQALERLCSGGLVPGFQQELCENAETSVLAHEVGHVIGLVDFGLPMVTDHKDPDHGPHSANSDCVMYWAYSRDHVIDLLPTVMGGQTEGLGFDEACLDDIAALRDAH